MSVLIRGMEMPKACVYRENGHLTTCPLYDIDGYCGALNTEASHNEGRKSPGCPLVPVPPHGRLGDLDALKASLVFAEQTAEWAVPALRAVLMVIDEMPTIIPAEEE